VSQTDRYEEQLELIHNRLVTTLQRRPTGAADMDLLYSQVVLNLSTAQAIISRGGELRVPDDVDVNIAQSGGQ
jgi:hypothetical protein